MSAGSSWRLGAGSRWSTRWLNDLDPAFAYYILGAGGTGYPRPHVPHYPHAQPGAIPE